jgi:7-carboxy-7-deazaguanine synthase
MSLEEILQEVRRLGCRLVELTGGEPLLQAESRELLRRLCDEGREVLLETNGATDISGVDGRVVRIMDIKCPSSGADGMMRWENIPLLTPRDEVKFVLADRADYEYAKAVMLRHELGRKCRVLLSPLMAGQHPELDPAQLAEWVLHDGLDVRLSLQLHKIIWPGRDRGV